MNYCRAIQTLAHYAVAPLIEPNTATTMAYPLYSLSYNNAGISARGRNSHVPKKANHGAHPCSSYMRKLRKKHHVRRPKADE